MSFPFAVAPGSYPYPDDDPTTVSGIATGISSMSSHLTSATGGLSSARAQLQTAWVLEAATYCDADIGQLVTRLPQMTEQLNQAAAACNSYATALTTARLDIDSYRISYRRVLSGRENPGSFQDWMDDPAMFSGRGVVPAEDQARIDAQLQALDVDYLRTLQVVRAAAEACSMTLLRTWAGPGFAPGSVIEPHLMDRFELEGLNVREIDRAAELAAELSTVNAPGALQDPVVRQKYEELYQLWKANEDDPDFASSVLAALGPDQALDLMTMIATVSDPDVVGRENIALFQAAVGKSIALATAGLDVDADGNLVETDGRTGGLSLAWAEELRRQAGEEVSDDVPVLGFVPLLATMSGAGNASSGLYHALARDMQEHELEHGSEDWSRAGAYSWRWNWQYADGEPTGADPFLSWSLGLVESPAAAQHIFSTDHELANYLLVDREWRDPAPGAPVPYPGMWNAGLQKFGDQLPGMLGQRPPIDESVLAFNTVVQSLGQGHQVTLPPELHHGVSKLVGMNPETMVAVLGRRDSDTMTGLGSGWHDPNAANSSTSFTPYSKVLGMLGADSRSIAGENKPSLTAQDYINAEIQAYVLHLASTVDPETGRSFLHDDDAALLAVNNTAAALSAGAAHQVVVDAEQAGASDTTKWITRAGAQAVAGGATASLPWLAPAAIYAADTLAASFFDGDTMEARLSSVEVGRGDFHEVSSVTKDIVFRTQLSYFASIGALDLESFTTGKGVMSWQEVVADPDLKNTFDSAFDRNELPHTAAPHIDMHPGMSTLPEQYWGDQVDETKSVLGLTG